MHRRVAVPTTAWPRLRDLFLIEWPKHIVPYSMLQNYISWNEKDPSYVRQSVEIYCLDADWEDGTFYLVNDSYLFFHTLDSDNARLESLLLMSLDNSKTYRCRCVYDRHLALLNRVVQRLGMEKSYEMACYLVHMPREIALDWDHLDPPEGIIFKPLTPDHAKIIAPVYPLRDQTSPGMFERIIRYNTSLGAFDEETGNLVAWCMQFQSGEMTALQVVDKKWLRSYLGSVLTACVGRKLAELGFDLWGIVASNNDPPQKLIARFRETGVNVIGMMHHVVFEPKRSKL
ncbi:uncharacterized protein LOC134834638 [Culicoides brevitarsis]|uniref:uncharacterized protein LOC134834638 n=1 Tax=Culicoides brevitarsis TaxID=469753 RepID=UPI00307BE6D0